jgi:hypothetical protein
VNDEEKEEHSRAGEEETWLINDYVCTWFHPKGVTRASKKSGFM